MSKVELGSLIYGESEKDAIHIAIAPVIANESLNAGDHIGLVEGVELVGKTDKPIGIVDPFLKKPVKKGDKFYMCLYPNTIASLRHEWIHPSFIVGDSLEEYKNWITWFASEHGMDYDEFMQCAEGYHKYNHYEYDNSERYKSDNPEDWLKFWDYYAKIMNEDVSNVREGWGFFTCSC